MVYSTRVLSTFIVYTTSVPSTLSSTVPGKALGRVTSTDAPVKLVAVRDSICVVPKYRFTSYSKTPALKLSNGSPFKRTSLIIQSSFSHTVTSTCAYCWSARAVMIAEPAFKGYSLPCASTSRTVASDVSQDTTCESAS